MRNSLTKDRRPRGAGPSIPDSSHGNSHAFRTGHGHRGNTGRRPAWAGSYPFTLHNFTSSDVSGVAVKNGKVIGFKRVLAKSSATFTVEYPDGQCVTPRVRVKFAKGGFSDQPNHNVCTGGGVTVVGR